jgi:hypothetical protein
MAEQRTRREFLVTTGLSAGALAVAGPDLCFASWPFEVPMIIRWGSRSAGFASGVAGLIITEVILGVLKAYDIDIEGTVERLVRTYIKHEPDQSRPYRLAVVPSDARWVDRIVNASGRCVTSGALITTRWDGFDVSHPTRGNEPILVPSSSFWAALRDDRTVGCLERQQCGYPTDQVRIAGDPRKNFHTWTQQFEGGIVRLVVDLTYESGPEGIFRRNLHEQVWLPGRG